MAFVRRHQRFLLPHSQMLLILVISIAFLTLQCDAFSPLKVKYRAFLPLAATSSKHLKEQQHQPPRKKKKKENAVKRLARAAANAAALYPPEDTTVSAAPRAAIGNLRQLTQAIDEQLRQKQQANFSRQPHLQPQDSMSSLLGYNEEHQSPHSTCCFHVALVFGKTLQDDQVTVEYAARIRSLVELLKDEDCDLDVVCFCGSTSEENYVADADAGYIFFRLLCAAQSVDLSEVNVYIDRTAKDEGTALQNMAKHLQAYYVPHWLKESAIQESTVDEYGQKRMAPRKKIHIHLSLISTGYHLCNLNDIHHRSPGQSLLRPIELMRKEYSSIVQHDDVWDDDDVTDQYRTRQVTGIVDTSWTYRYATYPYLYAKDDAVAFMARCYLLGEELVPLFINLKGVVREVSLVVSDGVLLTRVLLQHSFSHSHVHLTEGILSARQLLGPGIHSAFPSFTNGGIVQDQAHFAQ